MERKTWEWRANLSDGQKNTWPGAGGKDGETREQPE